MKSHIWLLEALLSDSALQCSVPPSEIARDLRTIKHRVDMEGLSFLTITLPSFDSALLGALAQGCFPSTGVPGFRSSGGLPSFLRGFLRKVFDASGSLLDEPSVTAVACLHQICLTFKKVKAPCSESRVRAAMRSYIEVDRNLPGSALEIQRGRLPSGDFVPSVDELSRIFNVLFGDALRPLDRKIFEGERIEAKHGPGATAEKVKYNDKFRWSQWTERLDKVFFPDAYIHAMEHAFGETASSSRYPLEAIAPELETPVRVIHVPKTMKVPRIIAIEPVVMQYMQQGLLEGITKGIKESFMGSSTSFDDQSYNANRALEGSRTGEIATLDLSEASDRVSFWLVDSLVRPWLPNLMDALDATRSRRARVPYSDSNRSSLQYGAVPRVVGDFDSANEVRPRNSATLGLGPSGADRGGAACSLSGARGSAAGEGLRALRKQRGHARPETIIDLRKFASMGSAVCFPVEAMVFTTIAFAGVAVCRGLTLTPRLARSWANDVSVFGDDIIVPSDAAPTVAFLLEAYGLKVNRRKSFWTGKFRESCGTDAFMGERVTPSYLKTLDWGDRSSLNWLALWVSFSNSLYHGGFWETARIIRKRLALYGYRIPMVSATSPAVGYHNVRGTYEWTGWDGNLHQPMVKAFRHRTQKIDSPLDGTAALRKLMTTPFNKEPDHLLRRATRSSSVSTQKRWTRPY